MSEENVEIVREVIQVTQVELRRRDPGAVFHLDALDDDLEWIPTRRFPGPRSYRGREGFIEVMDAWMESFEDWSFDIERLIGVPGNRVLALLHQRAIGRGSGTPVELHWGQLYELEDGRVFRIRNFMDATEAFEAAGLRE